jgi:quercetin dioxygenase-like cupin family protein
MHLRADFSASVALDTLSLPWLPSPDGSVRRRMLDRIGDEVARATSIVRYPPGSRFPPHSHGLGEEFLVLDGVFSDEHGDYPPGTYVRNPPGSAHAPRSDAGCTLFVKLRQMPPGEDRHLRIETGSGPWRPWRGLQRLDLFGADYETVFMIGSGDRPVDLEPEPAAGFEALVLAGSLRTDGEAHGPMTWLRRPSTVALSLASDTRLWIKTGHLSGGTPPA